MSIVVAHGYSMMYANQRQETDDPSGPLSGQVTPFPMQAASFGKGTVAPSNKAELDQYNSGSGEGGDFNLSLLFDPTTGDSITDWTAAWPLNYWAKVGGKFYRWDGEGEGWVTAPLFSGDSTLDPIPEFYGPDERYFLGRYPQTKKDLDQIVLDEGYFPTGQFVRLVGAGVGAQYFWTGSEWRPGVSDD